jgi:hypothetical protein
MNFSYLFLCLVLMPLSGEIIAGINGTIIDWSKKPLGNAEVFVIPSTHPKITSDER